MKVLILSTHDVHTSDVLVRELERINNWRADGYNIFMDEHLCWYAIFDSDEDAVLFKLANELNKT